MPGKREYLQRMQLTAALSALAVFAWLGVQTPTGAQHLRRPIGLLGPPISLTVPDASAVGMDKPNVGSVPVPPGAGPKFHALGVDESQIFPIDLGTALRLAGTSNLDIAQARESVNQARAQWQRARAIMLPSINLGSTYVDHEGQIQRTEGTVITANRDSLFVGMGPSAVFSFADAAFAPLVAQQTTIATQAGLRRVHNDTLQAVAEAYFAMLRARRRLARCDLALEYLTSDKASPVRAGSKGLLPVIQAMQKAGAAEALKAEVNRVQVDVYRRQEERAGAAQELRVAAAELARLLRLPPDLQLWPLEDFRVPLEFPGPYYDQPLDETVRAALMNRPEVAENQAFVEAAVARVRAARFRPYLPNLILNYNWGGFGGGPNPNPLGGIGPSGRIHNFNTRSDFDITLVWRLQNLGFGNLAEIREQESRMRQIGLRSLQIQDQVVTQVVQTNELIKGWKERVATSGATLFDKSGKPNGPIFESMRLNFERIREVEKTRPLEVLDSTRRLSDLLEIYSQALTEYDRSRFRLLVVMGLPPEEIIRRLNPVIPPSPR